MKHYNYAVWEREDGSFAVVCNGEDVGAGRFPTDYDAGKVLLRLLDGRTDEHGFHIGYNRVWQGDCPNCRKKNGLILARTEGFVIQQCSSPEYICKYEKKVGPIPR